MMLTPTEKPPTFVVVEEPEQLKPRLCVLTVDKDSGLTENAYYNFEDPEAQMYDLAQELPKVPAIARIQTFSRYEHYVVREDRTVEQVDMRGVYS